MNLNLTTFGFTTAVATVMATSTVLVSSPAHAISLTGSLSLSGGATVTPDAITFNNAVIDTANGDFTSLLGSTAATIKPIELTPSAVPGINFRTTGASPGFINFGSFTLGSVTSTLLFNLLPSELVTVFEPEIGVNQFSFPNIAGTFEFDGQTLALGFLNASNTGSGGSYDISLRAQPIPTPALLPGLLALGAGALRKRKVKAEAEAVEA